MKIERTELIEGVNVAYSKHKKDFYSSAKLRIDGYVIELESMHFPTIDEAVSSIKTRIVEAIDKFYQE